MRIIPENLLEQYQQGIYYNQLRPEGFFQPAHPVFRVNEELQNEEEEDENKDEDDEEESVTPEEVDTASASQPTTSRLPRG